MTGTARGKEEEVIRFARRRHLFHGGSLELFPFLDTSRSLALCPAGVFLVGTFHILALKSQRLAVSLTKMAAYKVVMIRHGESEYNQANKFCGWHDADLSQLGIQEAMNGGQVNNKKLSVSAESVPLLVNPDFVFGRCNRSVAVFCSKPRMIVQWSCTSEFLKIQMMLGFKNK